MKPSTEYLLPHSELYATLYGVAERLYNELIRQGILLETGTPQPPLKLTQNFWLNLKKRFQSAPLPTTDYSVAFDICWARQRHITTLMDFLSEMEPYLDEVFQTDQTLEYYLKHQEGCLIALLTDCLSRISRDLASQLTRIMPPRPPQKADGVRWCLLYNTLLFDAFWTYHYYATFDHCFRLCLRGLVSVADTQTIDLSPETTLATETDSEVDESEDQEEEYGEEEGQQYNDDSEDADEKEGEYSEEEEEYSEPGEGGSGINSQLLATWDEEEAIEDVQLNLLPEACFDENFEEVLPVEPETSIPDEPLSIYARLQNATLTAQLDSEETDPAVNQQVSATNTTQAFYSNEFVREKLIALLESRQYSLTIRGLLASLEGSRFNRLTFIGNDVPEYTQYYAILNSDTETFYKVNSFPQQYGLQKWREKLNTELPQTEPVQEPQTVGSTPTQSLLDRIISLLALHNQGLSIRELVSKLVDPRYKHYAFDTNGFQSHANQFRKTLKKEGSSMIRESHRKDSNTNEYTLSPSARKRRSLNH